MTMQLQERVVSAAEAVLAHEGAVGPLELLREIGFLYFRHIQEWQKGNEYYTNLESHIQCGEKKLADMWRYFLNWVAERKLEAFEAPYTRSSRFGAQPLSVTVDGNPERERFFRTRYRRAGASPAKKQRLEKKLTKPPDLVVFELVSEHSKCVECGEEVQQGEWIFLENQQPLCLTCADLDQLEYLPGGDTALTRRTRKYSSLVAVVVKFNRRQKRYERQGILAKPEAIARAAAECADDAEERAARRALDVARRQKEDEQLVADITAAIRTDYPSCPLAEAAAIAAHTATRSSGRVGRYAMGQSLAPDSIHLAVRAWIRHQHTAYDELLMQGISRAEARQAIASDVDGVAQTWAKSAPPTQ